MTTKILAPFAALLMLALVACGEAPSDTTTTPPADAPAVEPVEPAPATPAS